jgi:hypothetical protein
MQDGRQRCAGFGRHPPILTFHAAAGEQPQQIVDS